MVMSSDSKKTLFFIFMIAVIGFSAQYFLMNRGVILSIYQKFDVSKNLDDKDILNDIAIVSTSCDKRHELWAAQFPMLSNIGRN